MGSAAMNWGREREAELREQALAVSGGFPGTE